VNLLGWTLVLPRGTVSHVRGWFREPGTVPMYVCRGIGTPMMGAAGRAVRGGGVHDVGAGGGFRVGTADAGCGRSWRARGFHAARMKDHCPARFRSRGAGRRPGRWIMQRPDRWTGAFAAALLVALAAACDASSGLFVGGPNARNVQEVIVTPEAQTVQAGAALQFQARTVLTDGDTTSGSVAWSATGGAITTGGLYTAGQTAGAFRVSARAQNGVADTVTVNVGVPSTNPTLVAVVLTPATATVPTGGTAQFSAVGRLSNGADQTVGITWFATGGLVSGTGLYTAGVITGVFQVFAGANGLLDTATVTVTGPGG
jgi:hypothetical protein